MWWPSPRCFSSSTEPVYISLAAYQTFIRPGILKSFERSCLNDEWLLIFSSEPLECFSVANSSGRAVTQTGKRRVCCSNSCLIIVLRRTFAFQPTCFSVSALMQGFVRQDWITSLTYIMHPYVCTHLPRDEENVFNEVKDSVASSPLTAAPRSIWKPLMILKPSECNAFGILNVQRFTANVSLQFTFNFWQLSNRRDKAMLDLPTLCSAVCNNDPETSTSGLTRVWTIHVI